MPGATLRPPWANFSSSQIPILQGVPSPDSNRTFWRSAQRDGACFITLIPISFWNFTASVYPSLLSMKDLLIHYLPQVLQSLPSKVSTSGDCHPPRVFSWQTQFLPLLAHGIPHSLWNKNETELNVPASLVPLHLPCISISRYTLLKICQFCLYWHHLTTYTLVLYIRAMPSSWVTVKSSSQLLEYSPCIFSQPLLFPSLSPGSQVDKANAKFVMQSGMTLNSCIPVSNSQVLGLQVCTIKFN